ncbi:transporter substrate-binding domain-containing diguanylate cyclase [Salinibius halmophilus]|uniref:transporter substrate-binding domain-containing diguanylate cyclase n=1 Tax=Salinibius halmophilus TaxID=1853216 RepID=UPI000E66F7EB|nr:sensor domain-containing diguanylate cyclase [Salinibius halmophilus]
MKTIRALFLLLITNIAVAELVVTNSVAWKPYSYLDHNGRPAGLLIDYWQLYGEKTGQTIRFELVDWGESLELMRNGEADIHAGLIYLEERAEYLDFGSAITNLDAQLYLHYDLLGRNIEEYAIGGEIAVVAQGAEEAFVKQTYPKAIRVLYPNNAALLEAALAGKVKAFVADMQVANYYLYLAEEFNLFFPIRHLYSGPVQFATAKDSGLTIDTSVITAEELNQITGRWFHAETRTEYPVYMWPVAIGASLLLALVYILQLRRTVAAQTRDLRIANELLTEQAHYDPLTAALNRRAFKPTAERMLANQLPVQLILFDLDHFKQINDTFGHGSGDRVLTELALKVKSLIPNNALFARLGGEEFAVMIPIQDDNLEHWPSILGRATRAISFRQEDRPVTVTISSGVLNIYKIAEIDKLLSQADQLLYQAKHAGRDCWRMASFQ